jgi:Cu+-exporting ATPase
MIALMDVRLTVTDGMHCASCVRRFEGALAAVPGIEAVRVDLTSRSALIQIGANGPDTAALTTRLAGAGFTVVPAETVLPAVAWWPTPLAIALAALTFVVPHHLHAWATVAAAVTLFVPGWTIFRSGVRFAAPTMDTLIVLGALAALASGEPHAAAVTVALTLVGRLIEDRARHATGAAVERLAARVPATAIRLTATGEETVPLASVQVGDRLRLRPGDTVPVDGALAEGALDIDEALLTGESIPRPCAIGAALAGGTVVVDGTGVLVAERVGAETAVARLVHLVRTAALTKPTVQRLVDRIAAWFVPAVVLVSLVTWAVWWGLSGDPLRGLLPAAAVLVIACPCALGLATPTALVAAVGRCARAGIYVLTPRALEAAARIDAVAFDKTGTLTTGHFTVDHISVGNSGDDPLRVLTLAATVEQGSNHPLALALRCALLARAIAPSRGIVQDVRKFTHRSGAGSTGDVDGVAVLVGSAEHLRANGVEPLPDPPGSGSVVHVAADGVAIGVIRLRDEEREEAKGAIAQLKKRCRVVLISGDRAAAANATAARLDIDEIVAQCKPEQKLAQIERIRGDGHRVAFVGDGTNDAPVLAAADLGIAVGSGTDVARAAADVVLAGGDLGGVNTVLATARACRRTIIQNLVLAAGYNLVAIPFAAQGLIHPGWAAGMMAASSLLVVGNSLRLARG